MLVYQRVTGSSIMLVLVESVIFLHANPYFSSTSVQDFSLKPHHIAVSPFHRFFGVSSFMDKIIHIRPSRFIPQVLCVLHRLSRRWACRFELRPGLLWNHQGRAKHQKQGLSNQKWGGNDEKWGLNDAKWGFQLLKSLGFHTGHKPCSK